MNGERRDIDTLLNNGDFVGSSWDGPLWTPYAERITGHYRRIVPWYSSLSSGLSAPPSRNTVLTRPYQHDVLIFGASAFVTGGVTDTDGQSIYLQVTHDETGLTWAAPNILNSAPLPAYAGINLRRTPVLRLPDAFFLPKYTTLRLDWSATAFADQAFDARLTFVGVQLIDPFSGETPREIVMPDGKTIRVGDRVPWFGTCGIGERDNSVALQGPGFAMGSLEQRAQFLVSADCDIELHDLYCNDVSQFILSDLLVKLVDMGTPTNWNPIKSPVESVFGGERNIDPGLPFVKPYLLKKGHRINILSLLNDVFSLTNGLFVLRGVRLCEY